ncbi:type II secretion system F family protein [Microbacterium resistens]|uniref:type II secretion system F family protein n=1 Tax=Microbacterium resistens TaxID=156977 RepID=UPI00366EBE32
MVPLSIVTDAATAVLLGGLLAVGTLILLAAFPRWRTASLILRVAPHVRDVVDLPEGRTERRWRMPVAGRGLAFLRTAIAGIGPGDAAVAVRLAQAGSRRDVASFRSRQLAAVVLGLLVGALATLLLVLLGRMSVPALVLPAVSAGIAGLGADALLTVRARARVDRIAEELPTVLEFFALCLSAGEGLRESLRRVASVGSGELSAELRSVMLAVGTGSTLAEALTECAQRLQIPAFSRAVDQVVAALERGAPLASVLQAQAADAREETKRDLIERAGRKEILMLLPLVFLILPLSIVFAVFPGLVILRMGIG